MHHLSKNASPFFRSYRAHPILVVVVVVHVAVVVHVPQVVVVVGRSEPLQLYPYVKAYYVGNLPISVFVEFIHPAKYLTILSSASPNLKYFFEFIICFS